MMANLLTTKDPAIMEIVNALGLKNVTRLVIRMRSSSIVQVDATFYPEKDGVMKLVPVLKKYNLVPKKGEK